MSKIAMTAAANSISRGFHRLGIFVALSTLLIFAIVGANSYYAMKWWTGGVLTAAAVYGLTRLLGWTINGFSGTDSLYPLPSIDSQSTHKASTDALPSETIRPADTGSQDTPSRSALAATSQSSEDKPSGITGWLILPAFGTIISPFLAAKGIYDLWLVVRDFSAATNQAAFLYIMGSILINTLIMCAWAYSIFLMLLYRASFPRAYMTLLAIGVIVTFADTIIASTLFGIEVTSKDVRDLTRTLLTAMIWIPYMLMSKRVKNTFINA